MIELVSRPPHTGPVVRGKEEVSPPGGWEGLNRIGERLAVEQCRVERKPAGCRFRTRSSATACAFGPPRRALLARGRSRGAQALCAIPPEATVTLRLPLSGLA
jgi:hypothetical protein